MEISLPHVEYIATAHQNKKNTRQIFSNNSPIYKKVHPESWQTNYKQLLFVFDGPFKTDRELPTPTGDARPETYFSLVMESPFLLPASSPVAVRPLPFCPAAFPSAKQL